MKINKFSILSLIFVMLTAISFEMSVPKIMDSTLNAQVEISIEEKAEEAPDEKLMVVLTNSLRKDKKLLREIRAIALFNDRLYLNKIFRPPRIS